MDYDYEVVVDWDDGKMLAYLDSTAESAHDEAKQALRDGARRVEVRRRQVLDWETVWVSP